MTYNLRPVSTYEEFKACERLQADVLGYADLEIAPYQLLQSFATCGGAVIGAFDAGVLVGFVMGYTGLLEDGTPYHRSQRLAVLPSYRGQGVGEGLKRAQAALAVRYGLNLMCWTYDPLRSVNAHLNIHKLGAISQRYLEHAYAATSSPRDAGVAVDRLWVEWDLRNDERRANTEVSYAAAGPECWQVVLHDADSAPSEPDLTAHTPVVVIQIPPDIDAVRALGAQRVADWRRATRAVFTHYLGRGYRVVDYRLGQGYILVNVAS
ncbi:MAG: GNAT family N-acetyltransferase [Chloroflexi bacterium]|nr:GNAT family N-acetyltransferase [Chloroflexota bacterium]